MLLKLYLSKNNPITKTKKKNIFQDLNQKFQKPNRLHAVNYKKDLDWVDTIEKNITRPAERRLNIEGYDE